MESEAFDLFYKEQYHEAKKLFETLSRSSRDNNAKERYIFNIASCAASLGDYEEASESFATINSDDNDLLYNKALCAYKLGHYEETIRLVAQMLVNCENLYPELIVKHNEIYTLDDERYEILLQESHIIEAQNLRSAAMFELDQDLPSIQRCLNDLPIKRQDLLDCITLHNKAIYEHQADIESTISKISYLSRFWENSRDQPELAVHLPRETLKNLLILYSMHDESHFQNALKLIQTNRTQIEQNMTREEFQFFDIYFNSDAASSSDELVYRRLDKLVNQLLEMYPSTSLESEKDQLMDLLMVVISHEGTILWHNDQYIILERLLLKVHEKVQEFKQNTIFQINLAHTIFMTDTRFDVCVKLYEDILEKLSNDGLSLIDVDPQVLSGLCVSYVLTGRNNEAEALIKDIESLEEPVDSKRVLSAFSSGYPERTKHNASDKLSQLCYVNLVIGTLYCVKYNYDFGLTRIFKSLEPLKYKLNMRTWFYTKRCILSAIDCHCKQMIYLKDDLLDRVVTFLIECEKVGFDIPSCSDTSNSQLNPDIDAPTSQDNFQGHQQNTVSHEAGYLRSILLTVIHD